MNSIKKMPSLSAFIICWEGKEKNAQFIADQLVTCIDELVVIYSNKSNTSWSGKGTWQIVPDDWFFGRKFAKALELNSADEMLLVQADASCEDWATIVNQYRETRSKFSDLGLWAPEIDFTPWDIPKTEIARTVDGRYSVTMQTDGIVLGITSPTLERLKKLNYENNNLGHGIDWVAILFCYVNNLMVLRDLSVKIIHPESRGYSTGEAIRQMEKFLEQLTMTEKVMYLVLLKLLSEKKA
jgi:hypothetical protein